MCPCSGYDLFVIQKIRQGNCVEDSWVVILQAYFQTYFMNQYPPRVLWNMWDLQNSIG